MPNTRILRLIRQKLGKNKNAVPDAAYIFGVSVKHLKTFTNGLKPPPPSFMRKLRDMPDADDLGEKKRPDLTKLSCFD